jgi:hypothetical protein
MVLNRKSQRHRSKIGADIGADSFPGPFKAEAIVGPGVMMSHPREQFIALAQIDDGCVVLSTFRNPSNQRRTPCRY